MVGRAHQFALLRAAVTRALAGRGGVVLVTGEAGIGKTTLVSETAASLGKPGDDDGALVVATVCQGAEGTPGYWPWAQIVRRLRRDLPAGQWRRAADAAGGDLSFLLGGTAARPADARPGEPGPDDAALRLHDAVTTLLVTVSDDRPLVVVLDDLHRADPASVRLLNHLAHHVPFERILLVAAYRDVEAEAPGHPLARALTDLAAKATTVTLTGLDAAEVAVLMTRTVGREPEPEQAAEVWRRTGGNPFFVEQTVRLWHSSGTLDSVAPRVRDAVEHRLAYLPPKAAELLGVAAVLGHDFTRRLLAEVAAVAPAELDALLNQAVTARLVMVRGAGRFAFAHDLIRETLYDALGETDRRRHHAAVVRSLRLSAARGEPVLLSGLARHAALAVPEVTPTEAVGHIVTAARDASARLAAEEAAAHYRSALDLLPRDRIRERAEIALELGREGERAGDIPTARRTLNGVVAAARELDDAVLLAHAAVGLYRLGNPTGKDRSEVDLLDEAAAALTAQASGETALLARVLAAASMARTHQAFDDETGRDLSARAVRLARSADDADALGRCLLARHDALWEPGTARERLAVLDETSAAARRSGDRELLVQASALRTLALLEEGDPRAHEEHAAYVAATERLRLPRPRYFALIRRAAFATLTGDLDDAKAYADEARALGERIGDADTHRMWRDLRWAIDMLRGDFDGLDDIFYARGPDTDRWVRLLAAVTAFERGDDAEALALSADAEEAKATMPRRFAPMWLRYEAQAAAASADPRRCAAARKALAPLTGRWLVVTGGAVVCGPTAYWTAGLDAAQGHLDAAVAGYTAARQAADRLGARPWSALSGARLGEVLLRRAAEGDAARADALLAEAERTATALGMPRLAHTCRDLRAAPTPYGAPEGSEPPADNVFRFDGTVWTIRFAGRVIHLPDAKGLRDLHTLLARPGTAVSAVELLNPAGGPTASAAAGMGADAVLDEAAKTAYRRRLATLDDEIDRAVTRHDDRRAAELDAEREALLDELRRYTGLGGRPRRLGDTAERARQAVTARVRHTLRRLADHHPALADHLQASVTTGSQLCYRPAETTPWQLGRDSAEPADH